MGKILDFIMAKDWEEFQRVQLYKKIGNYLSIKDMDFIEGNKLLEIIK